jgi:hypothetical protein
MQTSAVSSGAALDRLHAEKGVAAVIQGAADGADHQAESGFFYWGDDLAGDRYKKNLPPLKGQFPFLYSICVAVLFS